MADKLTLNDLNGLGLSNVTPAEQAANDPNAIPIEQKVERTYDKQTGIEVIKPKEQPVTTTEPTTESKSTIVKPTGDGSTHYGKSIDISKMGTKKHEPTPYERTMGDLYDKVDKNIERTKKELTKPGGRIDQAKKMYIDDRYSKLIARAKNNKRLADHIKAVNDFIETDPRFDDISEYERRGYILFKVARDTNAFSEDYFGERTPTGTTINVPRLSSDVSKEVESYTTKEVDDSFLYDDNSKVVLSNGEVKQDIPNSKKKTVKKEEEDEEESLGGDTTGTIAEMRDDPTTSTTKEDEEVDDLGLDDDEPEEDTTSTTDEDTDTSDDEDDEIDPERRKEILHNYKKQLVDALKLDKTSALEGFTISTKPIKLSMALSTKNVQPNTSVWGLQYTGTPIEMSPLSGEEIILLNPNRTDFDTVGGLKTFFSTIYHHVKNTNKPPFETWLKQISDNDVDNLIFAVYVANFKDSNYITYSCPKKTCANVFIEKKEIDDMVVYPNKETEERFKAILSKETVDSQMYKSRPILLNNDYAVGVVTQSLYSSFFEPAALNKEFTDKYSSIVNMMPNIDRFYRIDNINKLLIPIEYKNIPNSLSKTVQAKVKLINTICKTLTSDERSILLAETTKISTQLDQNKITFQVPATVCPVCGEPIPAVTYNPLQLLFTRAQLPIIAASIQE